MIARAISTLDLEHQPEVVERVSKSWIKHFDTALAATGAIKERQSQPDTEAGSTSVASHRKVLSSPPSPERYELLVQSHLELTRKQFAGGLTPAESRMLRLIHWALDTQDNEEESQHQSVLDKIILAQEKLSRDIETMMKLARKEA